MQQKIKNSLMLRTMSTLIFYSTAILVALYLFQFTFLNYYYERYKINEVNSIASKLEKNISQLDSYLEAASTNYELCIERVTSKSAKIYNENQKGCILSSPTKSVLTIMEEMISNDNKESFYKLTNPKFQTKAFLYGINLSDGSFVFINSQLETLDKTSNIIRGQLVYILILLIIISIVISFFISNMITKPIREITEKAKILAKGNLKVEFKSSTIAEIDELSETLNYAKEELIKTDDYRRDLMANVGHDLKTPLTLIRSYAEMVRDISYKNNEKRNEHLNVIINETERLNNLVEDIIVLSKMESFEEELNLTKYDLYEQIEDIINKFKILEITENYHFILNAKSGTFVNADKDKIAQVLYNLLGNAINYTGEDMQIYIDVVSVKNGYKVKITDTGVGIKKEDLSKIWNRYYKTDKKHKRNKVGTGLGLSIVRNILEAHKCEYGVKSTINKGTTFYFILKK